jgi:hypothetical protein
LLLHGREQAASLLIRIRHDHVHADHRMRTLELMRGLEAGAIDLQRLVQGRRSEVRGESVREANYGGELRAE